MIFFTVQGLILFNRCKISFDYLSKYCAHLPFALCALNYSKRVRCNCIFVFIYEKQFVSFKQKFLIAKCSINKSKFVLYAKYVKYIMFIKSYISTLRTKKIDMTSQSIHHNHVLVTKGM